MGVIMYDSPTVVPIMAILDRAVDENYQSLRNLNHSILGKC